MSGYTSHLPASLIADISNTKSVDQELIKYLEKLTDDQLMALRKFVENNSAERLQHAISVELASRGGA